METARSRVLVAAALFSAGFLVLALRLVDLGLFERVAETAPRYQPETAVVAGRADIVDRNGVLLATSLRTASLYADPKLVLDAEDATNKLMVALPDLNRAEVLSRLKSHGRFEWIKRDLTPEEEWRVNSLGIPGLAFEEEDRRVYPQGALASHILGFVDVDGNGLAGVERFFDNRLGGSGMAGQPLTLSVDMRVQHVLREEMAAAVDKFSALGAAGVVLDAESGEIIALSSLPDFDPNNPGSEPKDALFNRVVQGVYELGSGFKAFTVAMALEAGTARLDSVYDATKPIRVARFLIRDHHPKARPLTVPEVFVYSSNIGAAKMALDVGGEKQRKFLSRLGMMREPTLELMEAAAPIVPQPWREVTTMTVSYGHGLAVTPLHLATGVAAMVNGGRLIDATLLRQDQSKSPDAGGDRIISPETSRAMRQLLRLVVTDGTGSKAEAAGYRVGGKTGSAEKSAAGGYRRRALISSFVGAFPMDDPRYVVFVLLDEPSGIKETFNYATGGWTAAPVVGHVVRRIGPMLGVAPRMEPVQAGRAAKLLKIGG
jgi:cell division protein FtsI (penicillin-binding protein 3)